MKIEVKKNLNKSEKIFSYVNISGLYINELCFDVFEGTTSEEDYDFIEKIINELIDVFENKTEFFYYTKCEEIFQWPRFLELMKLIYSIFDKKGLSDRLKFIDNNTSFKFKNNNWNYEGLPIMLGHIVNNFDKNENDFLLTTKNIDKYVSQKNFEKTFLSLNGRPKEHREELVQFIVDNNLTDKFFYSFGTSYGNNQNHPLYKTLDDDFQNNIRGVGLRLSGYEKKAFCYIITENSISYQDTTDDEYLDSLIEYKPNLFSHITEKITRGIGTMMPFILIGQPYTLQILKELGFKTFDKWWDESYDNEEDLYHKMNIIKKNILEISKWNLNKCKEVYQEMLPTLYHNFNTHENLRIKLYNKFSPVDMFEFQSDNESYYKSQFQKKIL